MSLASAFVEIRELISAAALRVGRQPSEVTLLAVSKGQPLAKMREAYALGVRDFGENYAQELSEKARALAELPDLHFHFIGHLQSNKARQIVPLLHSLHSVDRLSLVKELAKQVARLPDQARRRWPNAKLPVFIEVNLGREPAKHGVLPEELEPLAGEIEKSQELGLGGLMCIPPQTGDPRSHFQHLALLREQHGGAQRLPHLSMGMSSDFEHAIESGATIIRIGTLLFGERAPESPTSDAPPSIPGSR